MNEAESIKSTNIWAFSSYTYLKAFGHNSFIFYTNIPNSYGFSTFMRSVNLILSWYFIYSSSTLGATAGTGLGGTPGKVMAGRKVLTIFLKDF